MAEVALITGCGSGIGMLKPTSAADACKHPLCHHLSYAADVCVQLQLTLPQIGVLLAGKALAQNLHGQKNADGKPAYKVFATDYR